MGHDGEMVQAFLDQQPDDAVGVENKVAPDGIDITNHPTFFSKSPHKSQDPYVSSAISCGV